MYFYEGMLVEEYVANQVTNQQQVSVIVESHTMNVELHLVTELYSGTKLQNEVEAHSNSKIGGNAKLPNRDAHSDPKLKDKMKKQELSQDCLNMSKDIILQLKSLEIKMLDQ